MTRWKLLPIIFLLVIPASALAQIADTTSYFPLEVGNTWTYFRVFESPSAPPDTVWRGTYKVVESVSINDTLYYVSEYPFSLADTLRSDDENRIWARVEDRDVLLFDFGLEEGQAYHFESARLTGITFEVTISRGRTVDVGAGVFENCVVLDFDDPQVNDEEHFFTFAPGVGIVHAIGGLGDYVELYSADIAGGINTPIEDDDRGHPQLARPLAYPNPLSSTTTIIIPFTGSSHVTATVYNALGREVEVLAEAECDMQQCVLEWDGSEHANGSYYLQFEQAVQLQTIGLILSR